MHGWETRMLLKHYLDQGISKAELSRRFGVSRRTIHSWIEAGELDPGLVVWGDAVFATASRGPQAGSVQGDHRVAA